MCVCDRIQPIGLVERIQAIAQNMSDMALRVEQILQRSMANNRGRIFVTHLGNTNISVSLHMTPSPPPPKSIQSGDTFHLCPHKPDCRAWIPFEHLNAQFMSHRVLPGWSYRTWQTLFTAHRPFKQQAATVRAPCKKVLLLFSPNHNHTTCRMFRVRLG